MISDVMGALGQSLGARVTLVLFFLLFVGIVIWTLRGGRHRFHHESRLPFDDGPGDAPSESQRNDR